jgi:large subunit ribosomal protein L9
LQTTFILKRRTEVPLYKKNEKPTRLRGRHFNYVLIENTNVKKHENIDIILTTYVDGVGRRGEIVSVTPNYAYEKLLLPGLGTYVTPEATQKYTSASKDVNEEVHSSPYAKAVSQSLAIMRRINLETKIFRRSST